MNPATITRHETLDWCHLCGRRDFWSADVSYADNAENDTPGTALPRYLRVCHRCAVLIARVTDHVEVKR